MATILITLTSYNMDKNSTEEDFDDWVGWVSENLNKIDGLSIDVDSYSFGHGPSEDSVSIVGKVDNEEELESRVREALEECWENYCCD